MSNSNVQIMLTIPKKYRDFLRTLSAKQNLQNPDQIVTAAALGKQILCDYLEKHLKSKPNDEIRK